MLFYAGDVAERRGATMHRHQWSPDPPVPPEDPDEAVEDWVLADATPLLDAVGGSPLLIGKSLGSYAASLAAERGLPAVWLTPLLIAPPVTAALEQATAPFLLIGGTADRAWDGAAARLLTPHVCEVDGADHGMYVPGPLVDSIAVLGRIVQAVEDFLDTIGWPAGP